MSDVQKEYDEFAYIVSHDLSAPLRQVKGFMDIFLEDMETLTNDQIQSKDMMVKALNNAEDMIDGLLRLSRVNKHELSKAPLNLQNTIQDILKDYPDNHIILNNLPEEASIDEYIFKTVIKEVIDNAVKFQSADRSLEIVISEEDESTTDNPIISVSDNGIGVEEDYIDRAFLPLQQLHPKQAYEGVGIGLPLCKKMMAIHQGSIRLQSNNDHGLKAIIHF